jgi:Holliday junction resolvasome RuvABC endonuclease subunit
MAKLNNEQVVAILQGKGFVLKDISSYETIKSPIIIQCNSGHDIYTTLETARKQRFVCPKCDGGVYKYTKNGEPPAKKGVRVLGFDNATKMMGVSVFDDGELVFYNVFNFNSKSLEKRLLQIFDLLNDYILPEWEPDQIFVEDIQMQRLQYVAFKALGMLLGVIVISLEHHEIPYEVVSSKIWRADFLVKGRSRDEQKSHAIQIVKDMYNLEVSDDAAEAILIGKYGSRKLLDKDKKIF